MIPSSAAIQALTAPAIQSLRVPTWAASVLSSNSKSGTMSKNAIGKCSAKIWKLPKIENIAGPRECPSAGKKFIAANKTKLGVTAKNNLSQVFIACRSLMGYLLFNFYKLRGQPLKK